MHLFSGKLVVTVQAGNTIGDIDVVVKDKKAKLQNTIKLKVAGK